MEENSNYKKYDELIRQKFEEATEAPTNAIWENIEKELNVPNKKPFWQLSKIMMLMIVASVITWFVFKENKTTLTKNESNKITINEQEAIEKKDNEKSAIKKNNNQFVPYSIVDTVKNNSNNEVKALQKNSINYDKIGNEDVLEKNKPSTAKNSNSKNKNGKIAFEEKENLMRLKDEKRKTGREEKNELANGNIKNQPKAFISTKQITKVEKSKPIEMLVFGQLKGDTNPYKTKAKETVFAKAEIEKFENTIKKNELLFLAKADSFYAKTKNKFGVDSVSKTTNASKIIAKQKQKKKYDKYLQFYISPSIAYNNFANTNIAFDMLQERGNLVFGGAALYKFGISKKVTIGVGLGYNKLKFSLSSTPLTFNRFISTPYIFNTGIGEIPVDATIMRDGFNPPSPTFPTQFKINYNYSYSLQFITMPLEISYKLIDNKIGLSIGTGITPQFLMSQNATLNLLKEKNINTIQNNSFDLNKLSLSGNLGLSLSFQSKQKWNLFIAPNYQFLLGSLTKAAVLNNKISSLGINIGMTRKL